jgi:predicted  nucleic acid-binding Zn-ribbon protein
LRAPLEEQHALIELQAYDSAIDRLTHRRATLPEIVRLAEIGETLAAIEQLTAERQGSLVTIQRKQAGPEDDIDKISTKVRLEEARALSGNVTSPKELTAIEQEVTSLRRRREMLEDELLELMEERETLEADLAELATRYEGFSSELTEVTKARDASLAQIDRELDAERTAREPVAARVGEQLRSLYDQIRAKQGGVGAAALVGSTCQGCRVSISPVELAEVRNKPTDEIKRCENCRRILVVE